VCRPRPTRNQDRIHATQSRELKIIVFRHGCSYRQRLENLLTQRGIQTAKPLEFGSLDAILGCVAAGVGITLLPKAVVASARKAGLVLAHELPPEEARVATMFIRRSTCMRAVR
jgi:DNA-binding transcriptional LysR family regulator